MADRSVTVRLSANVTAYQRAMEQARSSTAKLQQESGRDFQKLGSSMQNVGQKMSVGVTLPIVGAGAAALKMSNDFDAAFGQMVGLAGVAAEDVDGLKESVLDLAGETARAPQELAEALYFAASAGLDTQQAMDAVTIAAKAASAGMGTTQDIVGLAASAVASYGKENINAAEATDILVSTIREGRAEPAELASTLGRVLPIAAQLGVEFDEVGGTVAVLSNVFGDTNRTVTATQGMFVKLLSPTKQGREALADMGTSVSELHAAIDSDGLLGALELLKSKGFDTNATALRALFDDIKGFQAASALLATDQETLASTFGATANSAGSLETAFGALDEDAQAMKQSWVDIQVAMIQVGEVIGPIVADLAGGVGDLASAFSDLDPTLQKVIVGIAAAAAAAGPLLIVTGSLIKNYALLKTAMAGSNATMATGATRLSMVAKAAAVAATAFASFRAPVAGLTGDTDYLYRNVSLLEKPMQGLGRLMYELGGGTESAASQWSKFEEEAAGAFAAATSGVYTMGQLRERLEESTLSMEARNLITIEFKKQLDAQAEAEANLAEATAETTEATEEATEALSESSDAAKIIQNEIDKAATNVRRFGADGVENMGAVEEATDDTDEAIRTLTDDFAYLLGTMSNRGKYLDIQDGFDTVQTAAEDAWNAASEGAEDAEKKTRDHERAVDNLTGQVIAYADEIGNVPKETVSDIIALIDQGKLAEAEAALAELERDRQARVDIVTYYTQVGSSDRPNWNQGGPRASGGPTFPNTIHEVNEGGRSELFHENGRTFLMSANHGFVTPLPAAAATSSTWGSDGPIELGDITIRKLAHTVIAGVGVGVARSEAHLVAELRGGVR